MAAFPDQDLEITAEAAFGADLTAAPSTWAWTDLSDRLPKQTITINWGVLVGSGNTRSASASVQLINGDGALTPHHPGSMWWPYVDAGTPMRLSVRTNTAPLLMDSFDRTTSNGFGTADSGQQWAGGTLSAFACNAGKGTVSLPSAGTLRHHRAPAAHRDLDITVDVTAPATAAGASLVAGPTVRGNAGGTTFLFPAVEFAVGGTVRCNLYTDSPLTLVSVVAQPGLTYTAGTTVRLRAHLVGQRIRVKAWLASGAEPTAWTIDYLLAIGVFETGTHIGVVAFGTGGNTNTYPLTFQVDNLLAQQPKYPRIEGYIADVQPTFQPLSDGTTWSTVQVDIGGVATILERRTADPWSPLRRSIQSGATTPDDYWPLEDQQGSLTAASAWPDRPAMTVTGPAVFEFDTGEPDDVLLARYGSKALCSVAAGAKLSATVTAPNVGAWTVSVTTNVFSRAVTPATAEIRILEWTTPSSTDWTRWALVCTSTGHQVRAYNDSTSTVTNVVTVAEPFASLITYDVVAVQNGPNIDVTLMYNANSFGVGSTAGTMAPVTRIVVNPDRANTTGSVDPFGIRYLVGHVSVRDVAAGTTLPYYTDNAVYRADQGWYLEPAHLRAARIAAEARVPFRQVGAVDLGFWVRLNAQRPGGTIDLAKAAVDADSGGILYEAEHGWVLVPRQVRYNAGVDLTVDLATYCRADGTDQKDVLVPVLDLKAPNYITVERTGGGSRSYAAPAGYRQRRGTIPDKVTLDLLEDKDCGPHAEWRTHLGVDGQGANYPSMSVDFAANPALIDDWLLCRPGSRVQRLHQPTIAGAGTIDQVIDNAVETIGPRSWLATLDTSPAVVWQVGVWSDDAWPLDAGSTTVGAALTTGSTTVVFSSTDRFDLWDTTGGYLVTVDGEDMLVTAMTTQTGAGPWTQTATVTRGVNGILRTHQVGAEIHVKTPIRAAL